MQVDMQIMIGKKSTCLVYIYIHYVFKVCMHIYTYIHRKDRCICFNLFQNIFENPNVHSQRSWPNDTEVFQSQHVYWIPDGIGWLKAWFFWGDSWIMIVSKFWLDLMICITPELIKSSSRGFDDMVWQGHPHANPPIHHFLSARHREHSGLRGGFSFFFSRLNWL